jgi:uncharacterized protein (TIGR03118 family)
MLNRKLFPIASLFMLGVTAAAAADPLGYYQVNLTSNVPGLAANLDPNLRNPWGMSFGLNSPFWISNQVSNNATLYNAAGVPQSLVVATPPVGGLGPTGQVFAGGQGFVMKAGAGNATFVFSTLDGTIDAWNGGTSAVIQVDTPGATYTGLAIAGTHLYAADNEGGKIDVFDQTFTATTLSGHFIDPSLPAGFTPYNIQTVDGKLYVTYEMEGSEAGYIGVFDLNGNFLQHISDPHLKSPWGITLAPLMFGDFGGALLVGNEDEGTINAFNPLTGLFLGTLTDTLGHPIINTGLWALMFRSPLSTFDPNALFFTAGINDEADGLFGELKPAPEPATLLLSAFGLAALALAKKRRLIA